MVRGPLIGDSRRHDEHARAVEVIGHRLRELLRRDDAEDAHPRGVVHDQ